MKLPKLFRRTETKESATSSIMVMNPGQPVWSPRDYKSFADEGYNKNVVAYQAINRICEAVGSVKWTAWRGETELSDSPLLDLLKRPNPMQSGQEYIHAVVGFLLISGNKYEERVIVGGQPRELYALRPDRMKIIPQTNGIPAAYVYEQNSRKVRWDVDPVTLQCDVMHSKLFNPINDWYGMAPIEAGAFAIDQHNESMKWMQSLLQNSARPSGALVTKDDQSLSDDNYIRLKAQIEEQYQGATNAGRPMLLEGGLSWQAMGLSPTDMGIIEAKYSSARDVCLAFGVPPQLLGIPGDNTYSNYAEARLAFWEDTVIPLVDRLCADWNRWLGPLFGDIEIRADMDQIPAIADKRMTLWDMADKSTDLTINERRELKGFEPIEGGDVLLVGMGQISLQDATTPLDTSMPSEAVPQEGPIPPNGEEEDSEDDMIEDEAEAKMDYDLLVRIAGYDGKKAN
jgi:HK97 family phage portal protein